MTVPDEPHVVEDLLASIRDVLARECPIERVRSVMSGGADWTALWAIAEELGWAALGVPEEHGGLGFGLHAQSRVAEELGYAVFAAPLVTTMIAAAALADASREPAAGRVLDAIASGAIVAVAAGPTAAAEDDVLRVRTVLDGPRAAALVAARGDKLCVVHQIAADACQRGPGVDLARPTTDVLVAVTESQPVGQPASALTASAHVLLGAELVGVARRALDIAVAHAVERRQFGQRIGEFQGVKHRLANRAVDLIRARALVHEASMRPGDLHAASIAKAVASGAAVTTVKDAIQVTGALGTTAEHELPWLLRRARHGAQVFGDERHLYAGIGRNAVGQEGT